MTKKCQRRGSTTAVIAGGAPVDRAQLRKVMRTRSWCKGSSMSKGATHKR
jgi:hypothetical protein